MRIDDLDEQSGQLLASLAVQQRESGAGGFVGSTEFTVALRLYVYYI